MNVDLIAEEMGFRVERYCEKSAFYYYEGCNGQKKTNSLGETLCVDIGLCEDCNQKNSLPKLWAKRGNIPYPYKNWWGVTTYITKKDGDGRRAYNPTTNGRSINFNWLLEATEENFKKLLTEILARFLNVGYAEEFILEIQKLCSRNRIHKKCNIHNGIPVEVHYPGGEITSVYCRGYGDWDICFEGSTASSPCTRINYKELSTSTLQNVVSYIKLRYGVYY